MSDEKVYNHSLKKNIEWKFTPPTASHMSGMVERMIRSIRKVFSALVMNISKKMSDEVLETLFCEVENIINSRPLTYVSDSAQDLSPLTPSHLLILRDSPSLCRRRFPDTDRFRSRWRYVQCLSDQFWKRWLKEYLACLQKREKWLRQRRNIKVNDLVLMMNENLPRYVWPLARVINVQIGRDCNVRSVDLKFGDKVLRRPIHKLVLLEESD